MSAELAAAVTPASQSDRAAVPVMAGRSRASQDVHTGLQIAKGTHLSVIRAVLHLASTEQP